MPSDDPVVLAGDALITLTAALAVACVLAYHWRSGGTWAWSQTGRHVMAFMAALAAVLGQAVLKITLVDILHYPDPAWSRAGRVIVLAALPAVLAWRLWIIVVDDDSDERKIMDAPGVRSLGKAAVFVLAALVPAVVLALKDNTLDGGEAIGLAVLTAGSVVLLLKKNTAASPAARAVVAVFVVVADAVTAAWTDQVLTPEELTGILTALLGAIGVYLAGNDDQALSEQGTP